MTDPKYKYGLRMSGQKRFGTVGEVSGLFLYRRCFRKGPWRKSVKCGKDPTASVVSYNILKERRMISDKLFGLAFEYKKTKLWNILWDQDVFAVKLSGGRIGYISIMGAAGRHCALALYIGDEGFNSFHTVASVDDYVLPPLEAHERLLKQDCLQCAFEGKDDVTEEEREEAKKYARAHGIRISGKNAYPYFAKYRPNYCPWHLDTEQEQEDLCEALAAAIEMARLLREKKPHELGFGQSGMKPEEAPVLEMRDGVYVLEKTELPEEKPTEWPAAKAGNDIAIANLKKVRREGLWESEIVRYPEPVQNDPDQVPFFPAILLAVETETQYILPVPVVECYEENPEELLNAFMDALLSQNICPEEIKVRDERTYIFLEAFCKRMKIAVSIETDLPALDEAEAILIDHFNKTEEEQIEDMTHILDALLSLDVIQNQKLPEEMAVQLGMLADMGILPEHLEKKINELLSSNISKKSGRKKSGKNKLNVKEGKAASKESYVISVSVMPGCYRHIQISGNSTLLELHAAILDAFDFYDDHAHAFFMDNKLWSHWDSYFMEGTGEDDEISTKECKLYQARTMQRKPV